MMAHFAGPIFRSVFRPGDPTFFTAQTSCASLKTVVESTGTMQFIEHSVRARSFEVTLDNVTSTRSTCPPIRKGW